MLCSTQTLYESVARDQYEALHAVQHTDSVCQASGLFISIEYPMFGASPDGLVQCTCCGEGLVAIKCPHTLRESGELVSWPGCAWSTTNTVLAESPTLLSGADAAVCNEQNVLRFCCVVARGPVCREDLPR